LAEGLVKVKSRRLTSERSFLISNRNLTGTPQENSPLGEEILSESFPTSPVERAEAGYAVAVSGVERARKALAEARERAEKQALAYQAELTARIEADKAKRAEVVAELARLRIERESDAPSAEPINPEGFNPSDGEPSL